MTFQFPSHWQFKTTLQAAQVILPPLAEMITEHFIPYIKFESWALGILYCFPFVWDDSKYHLMVRDPPSRKLYRKLHILYFSVSLIAMASVLHRLSRDGCQAKSMEGLMLFLATVQAFGWSTTWCHTNSAMVLFNATMDFDRRTTGKSLSTYYTWLRINTLVVSFSPS